ncbi:MAG TPA: DUF6458 family protein [Candidatus Dormibacteraeota bacterium]|jgi:hypothetical protein|nr:DUF6458 family protein [Candidatus Dormibacteraeota bacterium]
MGLGVGIVLIALGAILAFAVNSNAVATDGVVNIHSVGYILLLVGIVAVVLSMAFWSSWGGSGFNGGPRRRTTIDES